MGFRGPVLHSIVVVLAGRDAVRLISETGVAGTTGVGAAI